MKMRAFVIVALTSLAVLATACSVPRDDHARVITNAPRNTSVPVTTSNVDAPRVQAKVYFVRSSDKKLEGVMTGVKDLNADNVASPGELLEALIVDGPRENRLESKIPKGVTFQVVDGPVRNEVIVILLNFRVDRLNRDALVLAFQQIVYTLTELPNIGSVQFSVSGRLYPVPLSSGGDKLVGQGVSRSARDYDPDTIYTTTTLAPTTQPPPSTAPSPSSGPSTAPGASAPTSAPAATSR